MPSFRTLEGQIIWAALIIGVFALAAWMTYSPCNMPLLWPSNTFLPQCQG